MIRRNSGVLIIVSMLLVMVPQSIISEETTQQVECEILVDWSNGTASEHAYQINNWSLVNNSETQVLWTHYNKEGIEIANGTIIPILHENDTNARILLPTQLNLGDLISINVIEQGVESFCSRAVSYTHLTLPTTPYV